MHVHAFKSESVLKWSIGLMLLLSAVEASAGYFSQSLALLSDAGHNFSDALSLVLALFAHRLQAMPPTENKTFGYHRAGVLAAFVNALFLIFVAGYIFYEAYQRIAHPGTISVEWMTGVALLGFLINAGVSMALLRGSHGDINIKGAFVHTAADAISTLSIVVGGILIYYTGLVQIDAALSFLIGALVLWSSVDIIGETLNILLEGLPRGIKLEDVIAAMCRIEGVVEVHDVHIWSLGSKMHAMSCHVGIADIPPSLSAEILQRINELLAKEFNISHTTVQFEHAVCDLSSGCFVPSGGSQIASHVSHSAH